VQVFAIDAAVCIYPTHTHEAKGIIASESRFWGTAYLTKQVRGTTPRGKKSFASYV